MSQKLIRSLLQGELEDFADARSLPVAWENVAFGPPAGQYLRFNLLKAPTDSADLAGAHREYGGVCQVSICVPKGAGPAVAEGLAVDIADLFPVNLRLSDGDFTVLVMTPCSEGPPIDGDTHYMVPVSFAYRADTI